MRCAPPAFCAEETLAESGRSKGQRQTLFALILLLVAVAVVPAAAAAGSFIADSSTVTVLSSSTTIYAVEAPNGTQIAFAHTAGTYSWTMPSGVTTAYVIENLTVGQMQGSSVNELSLATGDTGSGTVTFAVGNGATSFTEYAQVSASSLSSVSISISPQYLTGPTDQHAILEITSSAASYSGVALAAKGNGGVTSWFGFAAAEDIGYILGGTIVFILAILAMPWYDLEVHRITRDMPRRLMRGRRKAKGG